MIIDQIDSRFVEGARKFDQFNAEKSNAFQMISSTFIEPSDTLAEWFSLKCFTRWKKTHQINSNIHFKNVICRPFWMPRAERYGP